MDAITLPALLAFVMTMGFAILSPGPAIIACTRSAAARGREAALPYALGLAVGASLWCLFSVFGLTLLFQLVPQLFTGLKIVGGVYLVWIAWKMWRHAEDPLPPAAATDGPGFWSGIALNLSNPKPALFYASILLSLFPRLHGVVGPAFIYAVALSVEVTFYITVTTLMSTGPVRRRYFAAKAWIDRIAGALIGALGLTLILRH